MLEAEFDAYGAVALSFRQVVVIDFSNHHFIKDAIVRLEVPGVHISYVYSADFQSPNQRNASVNYEADAIPVSLGKDFKKYTLVQRLIQEKAWARACAKVLDGLNPDGIIAANCPVDVLSGLSRWAHKRDVAFGVWVQDMYGPIMTRLLKNKLGIFGEGVGKYYTRREHSVIAKADVLISIDRTLSDYMSEHCDRSDSFLVPNWAAIDDLPVTPKVNPWSVAHGLAETTNVIYTGTLGMKHSPAMIVGLAQDLASTPETRVVVVSEGLGADYLAREKAEKGLDNLDLLPFQDPAVLAQVLGAADVCTLLLNENASDFCIPSKVLGYMCAARPVVGALPYSNPVAKLITDLGIGESVATTDGSAYSQVVTDLIQAPASTRLLMGKRGRSYAEAEFSTDVVHRRLEEAVSALVR